MIKICFIHVIRCYKAEIRYGECDLMAPLNLMEIQRDLFVFYNSCALLLRSCSGHLIETCKLHPNQLMQFELMKYCCIKTIGT